MTIQTLFIYFFLNHFQFQIWCWKKSQSCKYTCDHSLYQQNGSPATNIIVTSRGCYGLDSNQYYSFLQYGLDSNHMYICNLFFPFPLPFPLYLSNTANSRNSNMSSAQHSTSRILPIIVRQEGSYPLPFHRLRVRYSDNKLSGVCGM